MEQGALPDDAPARPHTSTGGIVAAIGGALIVASTFFELVSATVGSGRNQLSSSRTYLDSDNGKIVLVLGVVVLVISLATLLRSHRDVLWSVVVAVCSLAALGLAINDRIDLDDAGSEIQSRLAASGTTGSVHVSIGPALYLAIAGGIVATVGAVIAARDRSV